MPFVNEKISAGDRIKYRIDEIDSVYRPNQTKARDWTIDHQKGIYLRHIAQGDEGERDITTWHLFWGGIPIELRLKTVSITPGRGGPVHSHKKVVSINIPAQLDLHRSTILSDLYDALIAYRDGGIYATATTFSLKLDV